MPHSGNLDRSPVSRGFVVTTSSQNLRVVEGERFDIHQRYAIVALVLEQMLGPGQHRVLDLGSNVNDSLGRRLDDVDVICVDIDMPDELVDGEKFIRGDALDLEFEEDAFDAVTAVDVLEHIPQEDRQTLLMEAFRVSKGPVVLAFPDGDVGVGEIESISNQLYSAIHGTDHRWLREHLDNKAPSSTEIERFLRDELGLWVMRIPSGYLPRWAFMTSLEFTFKGRRELDHWLDEIHEYYNRHIGPYDLMDPAYRSVLVAAPSEVSLEIPEPGFDGIGVEGHLAVVQSWVDAAVRAGQRMQLASAHRLANTVGEVAEVGRVRTETLLGRVDGTRQQVRDVASEVRSLNTLSSDVLVALNQATSDHLAVLAESQAAQEAQAMSRLGELEQWIPQLNVSIGETLAALNSLYEERLDSLNKARVRDEQKIASLEERLARADKKLRQTQKSEALRIGLLVTWPFRFFARTIRRTRRSSRG